MKNILTFCGCLLASSAVAGIGLGPGGTINGGSSGGGSSNPNGITNTQAGVVLGNNLILSASSGSGYQLTFANTFGGAPSTNILHSQAGQITLTDYLGNPISVSFSNVTAAGVFTGNGSGLTGITPSLVATTTVASLAYSIFSGYTNYTASGSISNPVVVSAINSSVAGLAVYPANPNQVCAIDLSPSSNAVDAGFGYAHMDIGWIPWTPYPSLVGVPGNSWISVGVGTNTSNSHDNFIDSPYAGSATKGNNIDIMRTGGANVAFFGYANTNKGKVQIDNQGWIAGTENSAPLTFLNTGTAELMIGCISNTANVGFIQTATSGSAFNGVVSLQPSGGSVALGGTTQTGSDLLDVAGAIGATGNITTSGGQFAGNGGGLTNVLHQMSLYFSGSQAVPAANVMSNWTSFTVLTNGFTGSLATGYFTNGNNGIYNVKINIDGSTGVAYASDWALVTNGVVSHIRAVGYVGANRPAFGESLIMLPAGCALCFTNQTAQAQTVDYGTVVITQVQ